MRARAQQKRQREARKTAQAVAAGLLRFEQIASTDAALEVLPSWAHEAMRDGHELADLVAFTGLDGPPILKLTTRRLLRSLAGPSLDAALSTPTGPGALLALRP